MGEFLRAFRAEDPDPEKKGPMEFIASTEGIKRDGKDLKIEQWDLTNYRKNPVVLWGHDYGSFGSSPRPPIGRAVVKVDTEARTLNSTITFDPDDEFAQTIERKYRNGFLNTVSVGWDTVLPRGKMMHEVTADEIRLDLLDISGVPVPGDPDALAKRSFEMLSNFRTIVGGPQPPAAAPSMSLDTLMPDIRTLQLDQAKLRSMSAYVDSTLHPSSLLAYRFIHHLPSGEAVWAGVAASMAELYLGSAQMPEDERRGVYVHLQRHYHGWHKEPPDYMTTEQLDSAGNSSFIFAKKPRNRIRLVKSPDEKDFYREIESTFRGNTKTKYMIMAIDLSPESQAEEEGGPAVKGFICSKTVFRSIVGLLSEGYELWDDKTGHGITVMKTGTGLETKYSVMPSQKPQPIAADILADCPTWEHLLGEYAKMQQRSAKKGKDAESDEGDDY